ncbi:MAG TPA: metal-dependent hydrolase [Sandaracinaceae bacterium LLY-WYZ-13_1]|nr:metal-dependent hydrolase [Sandaracinaceae bacterium LLY-WYZ-13_1]
MERPDAHRPIPVRAPRFALDEAPRAWLAGSPLASHVVDALSLLFPDGERFFIRSVRHYMDVVDREPALRARVRGFFGQEGRHGHAHDRFNDRLEAHGLAIEPFLRFYRRLAWDTIEPSVPPHLRLATTAALEHLTATLAELALDSPILDDADPGVRELLLWHACEEIEHKSVAFDVLARVDARRRTRVAGLAIGSGVLALFFGAALGSLMWQERRLPPEPAPDRGGRVLGALRRRGPGLVRSFLAFTRAGFHPDERDSYPLARDHLASLDARAAA